LVALVAPEHPVAHHTTIQLRELFQYNIVMPDNRFGVRQVVDRKARALGITPALAVTTNSIAMTRSLVRMGDLATILPYVSVRHDCRLGLLKAVTIAKPDSMNAEIDLCVRKDRPLTASVKGMLAALSETFD